MLSGGEGGEGCLGQILKNRELRGSPGSWEGGEGSDVAQRERKKGERESRTRKPGRK